MLLSQWIILIDLKFMTPSSETPSSQTVCSAKPASKQDPTAQQEPQHMHTKC